MYKEAEFLFQNLALGQYDQKDYKSLVNINVIILLITIKFFLLIIIIINCNSKRIHDNHSFIKKVLIENSLIQAGNFILISPPKEINMS